MGFNWRLVVQIIGSGIILLSNKLLVEAMCIGALLMSLYMKENMGNKPFKKVEQERVYEYGRTRY